MVDEDENAGAEGGRGREGWGLEVRNIRKFMR